MERFNSMTVIIMIQSTPLETAPGMSRKRIVAMTDHTRM
jgi:hypothetical protein